MARHCRWCMPLCRVPMARHCRWCMPLCRVPMARHCRWCMPLITTHSLGLVSFPNGVLCRAALCSLPLYQGGWARTRTRVECVVCCYARRLRAGTICWHDRAIAEDGAHTRTHTHVSRPCRFSSALLPFCLPLYHAHTCSGARKRQWGRRRSVATSRT